MTLDQASLVVSGGILGFCLLPLAFPAVRNRSRILLIVATAAMLAIVLFDLIPDLFELGGFRSLALAFVVWAAFSACHFWMVCPDGHVHAHVHDHHGHGAGHPGAGTGLLVAMALHCFSSGLLLVTSYEISAQLARNVVTALLIHKGFEAALVSSLIVEAGGTKTRQWVSIAIYCLSFPVGVAAARLFSSLLTAQGGHDLMQQAAMLITSGALGSLLGCLVFDFLLPSLRELRRLVARSQSRPRDLNAGS